MTISQLKQRVNEKACRPHRSAVRSDTDGYFKALSRSLYSVCTNDSQDAIHTMDDALTVQEKHSSTEVTDTKHTKQRQIGRNGPQSLAERKTVVILQGSRSSTHRPYRIYRLFQNVPDDLFNVITLNCFWKPMQRPHNNQSVLRPDRFTISQLLKDTVQMTVGLPNGAIFTARVQSFSRGLIQSHRCNWSFKKVTCQFYCRCRRVHKILL